MLPVSPFSRQPYRRRTWLRRQLPFALLDLAPKGTDCEHAGGDREWYNDDGVHSAYYHYKIVREDQL